MSTLAIIGFVVVGLIIIMKVILWITAPHDFVDQSERRYTLDKMITVMREHYTEDNLPTSIAAFFEDVLYSLPEGSEECNIEGLMEDEINNWREYHAQRKETK